MTGRKNCNLKTEIENGNWYRIDSTCTDTLYLDEEANVYLFSDEEKAARFTKKELNTRKTPIGVTSFRDFMWKCWSLGARKIVPDGDPEAALDVYRDKKNRNYSNNEFTRNLLLLLETEKEKYLRSLGDKSLIIPVLITTTDVSGVDKPFIQYGIVKARESAFTEKLPPLYLAFSDLDYYEAWRSNQRELFKPLEVEFWQFEQVYGNSGAMINPGEDTVVILTPELLKKVSVKPPEVSYVKPETGSRAETPG